MVFENYLLGFLFLIIGLVFRFFPPRKINSFYGYRTSQSMQNQHKWDFAQNLSAKYFIVLAIILLLTAFILHCIHDSSSSSMYVQIALMLFGIVFMLVDIENKLKKL